jgi:type 1 glutamine amidotransferase
MRNFHLRALLTTVGALGLFSLVAAQAPAPAPATPAAPPQISGPIAAQRGGGGQQLNEACGGRSAQPTIPCPNHVTQMMRTLATLPADPPARPLKPRKVLIWSRIPSAGYQHSSIPLAAKFIEELGKKTGAWTSDTSFDLSVMTAQNLEQYDAIFLSSTTGRFLDDEADAMGTEARRKAFLDFIRNGKGIAGVHATGDSYHGRGRPDAPAANAAAGGARPAAPPAAQAPLPPCSHRNNGPGGGGTAIWPEWIDIIGGYFKYHWLNPTPITVKIDDKTNPINAAFKGKSFNTYDEVYTFNGWSRDNVHVLTSIDYSLMSDCDKGLEEYPRADGDYGLSWIRPEGRGRLFYTALGHAEAFYWNNPAMQQHVLAGMQYALGDLKADDSVKKK